MDRIDPASYRYWRRALAEKYPTMDRLSELALSHARAERDMRAMLDRFGEWQEVDRSTYFYGAFASADLDDAPDGYTVRVLIGDDDMPIDWGDTEPTENERENARAFYVAIQVLGIDGAELYHDGIGGVDVIDLEGYLQRDWEDAAAYALIEYLYGDALRFATNEADERAYWEARDVVTVDA